MTTPNTIRMARTKATYESTAWKWMRYSAFLLIPLVWGHMILQDVIIGVHAMDLDYVSFRLASLLWRIYDALLLGFAFAHGVNGLRQVALDYIHGEKARKILNWALLAFWLVIFLIGLVALIAFQPTMPVK
jgi:succinate dehydrogenase / fumarate reductase, membrane anchor subunit